MVCDMIGGTLTEAIRRRRQAPAVPRRVLACDQSAGACFYSPTRPEAPPPAERLGYMKYNITSSEHLVPAFSRDASLVKELKGSCLADLLLLITASCTYFYPPDLPAHHATAKMSQPEDLEKRELARDHIESIVRDLANDERIIAFSEEEQKRIVRRIDIRLVLTLGSLYCISLLDRTNLGAASVAG